MATRFWQPLFPNLDFFSPLWQKFYIYSSHFHLYTMLIFFFFLLNFNPILDGFLQFCGYWEIQHGNYEKQNKMMWFPCDKTLLVHFATLKQNSLGHNVHPLSPFAVASMALKLQGGGSLCTPPLPRPRPSFPDWIGLKYNTIACSFCHFLVNNPQGKAESTLNVECLVNSDKWYRELTSWTDRPRSIRIK